ncbi:MAG TPA: hypothetical protein VE130_09520 [Nitrososphaeraceae archaeon]|nr:hypothetical protein [Nitrososphaeraceae archaeon]
MLAQTFLPAPYGLKNSSTKAKLVFATFANSILPFSNERVSSSASYLMFSLEDNILHRDKKDFRNFLWAQMKIEPLIDESPKLGHRLTRKPVDRSLLCGESVALFKAAIRNAATRDPYERRLIAFLGRISMDPDSFVDLAKSKPQAAEKKIISYIDKEVSCCISRTSCNKTFQTDGTPCHDCIT